MSGTLNISIISSVPNSNDTRTEITFSGAERVLKVCLPVGANLSSPDIKDTALFTQWGKEGEFPKINDNQAAPVTLGELAAAGFDMTYADTGRGLIDLARTAVGIDPQL
ncbi:hypothetical protein ACTG16_23250 [Aeromonas sp. 23P]|uniref:hypothetical protein n=1 Tax=Aeromonas sp. 23P TaxID=3452716 RepID=UPI003F790173|nr:hypothetical protein [Aeromonas veronii]